VLEKHPIDLVLIDATWDVEGPLRCVEGIRGTGILIPILITGEDWVSLAPLPPLESLRVQILPKPFGLSDLRGAIARCLAS